MSYQIDNQEIGIYISGLIEREFKYVMYLRTYIIYTIYMLQIIYA